MKKTISIISIISVIAMLFTVCASAAVNVEYEFNETDGYVYITVSPNQSNYKFMLSGNYSIFNVYQNTDSWNWKLTHQGSITQTNANWWALFPVVTRQIDSRTLDMQGIDLSELRNYDAECRVTYTLKGYGVEEIDGFVPIDIYELKPGYLTVNDIKTNVSGQEIIETSKIKKRDTIYYYDTEKDEATVYYTVYSPEFDNLNDIIFLKHNASITYEEDRTIMIIPDLTIKLSYSEAQRLINEMKVQTGLLQLIINAIKGGSTSEEISEDEADDKDTSKLGEEISEYEAVETSIMEENERKIDRVLENSIPSDIVTGMLGVASVMGDFYNLGFIVVGFTILGLFVIMSLIIFGKVR